MARRAYKTEAEKANRRLAAEYHKHVLFPRLIESARAYTFVEPFPLNDAETMGRFVDRAFGRADLCDLASARWALADRAVLLAKEYKRQRDEPAMGPIHEMIPGGQTLAIQVRQFRMQFRVPSCYIANGGYAPNADIQREMHSLVSDGDREIAEQIAGWAARAAERMTEIERAKEFVAQAVRWSGSTFALFRALPGLRGASTSLGVLAGVVLEAEQPYRGKDYFNTLAMDTNVPLWRTAWSEKHRPALLKMAAANASASTTKRFLPADMVLTVLDTGSMTP